MIRWISAAAAAATLTLALPAIAADAPATAPAGNTMKTEPAKTDAAAPVTLKGEVVDATCFFTKDAAGAGHKACAAKCLANGATPAFKAEDGTVYLLIAEHGKEKLLDTCKKKGGDTVTITGTVSEKGGMKALVVSDVKA